MACVTMHSSTIIDDIMVTAECGAAALMLTLGDPTAQLLLLLTLLTAGGDSDPSSIDTAKLPLDASCKPVYPHQYVQVNNIFEVRQARGHCDNTPLPCPCCSKPPTTVSAAVTTQH
jgi:hypothetical protein